MRIALICLFTVVASGCFSGWKSDGPWACEGGNVCPDGFSCDDGVCCKPGSTPACPTLPFNDTCPEGRTAKIYYNDADGDGVGWTDSGRPFCRAPHQGGWVELGGDCNDADETVGPRMSERCNAQDDDCDGVIDNGLFNVRWFRDADGDGFGGDCATCFLDACTQPDGYVERAGDCDDDNAEVFPGAPEQCNDRDDNCNGQLDDGPFIDVENPSDPNSTVFDCSTGLQGVCEKGGLQCVYSAMTQHFEKRCMPRKLPSLEVCNDGFDNDCDGTTDLQPGCGGPTELWSSPGVVMGAYVQRDAGATLPTIPTCGDAMQTERMAWLQPSWVGTGWGQHTLYANAQYGWDLSQTASLRLDFVTRSVGGASTDGGTTPPLWNEDGRAPSLVVQLCGATPNDVRRYVPATTFIYAANGGVNSLVIPMSGAGWTVTTHGNFTMNDVRRVELLVSPRNFVDITFTNRFAADGGGFGFFR